MSGDVGQSAEIEGALDPAYQDIEICACSTPGWTHHTGFHDFVQYREQRAAKAALSETNRRLREVFGTRCSDPCPHVGCQAQHIVADVRQHVTSSARTEADHG